VSKVLFIGSKQIGLNVYSRINKLYPDSVLGAVTFDDSNDIRTKFDDFKNISNYLKKSLIVISKPSELERIIDEILPDLCIVVGWYWIIKSNILEKVQQGVVGIHGSLLPKYRGFAPFVWQIINGESKSGISLFYIDKGMDTGDIIGQKDFEIQNNDTINTVLNKAESASVNLLEQYLPLLIENNAPRIKQKHSDATYCSKRIPEDGLINWSLSNIEINNFIRAQAPPYPCAFCFYKGMKLNILKSTIFNSQYYGIPGLVAQLHPEGAIVTCGTGAIVIHQIQVDGSKPQKASDILKFDMKLS
jgi:methionyl-tRNA formyltransferase